MSKINVYETIKGQDKGSGPIQELINSFDNEVEALYQQMINKILVDKKFKIGYNQISFDLEIIRVRKSINEQNEAVTNYHLLFPSKSRNKELFDEVFKLLSNNDIENVLRKEYLRVNQIEIPSFPKIKLDKLIQLYEFPDEIEEYIGAIVSIATENKFRPGKNKSDFYSEEKQELVFTSVDELEEKERHAIYLDAHQVTLILALSLFCGGFNNAKSEDYGYKSLPEIDDFILSKLKIDSVGQLVVDVKRIEQYFGSEARALPSFKISGS